jgi:NifU-like protein involved in Fe-S cluster formation
MNVNYSNEIMNLFVEPQHVYAQQEINLMGHAGDISLGEYIHIYFQVESMSNYIESKINRALFSAMGSVMLITAAEKFCSIIEGLTFQDAIKYCDPEYGLAKILSAPEEKMYSVNFVLHAFYNALETLTVS